MVKYLFKKYIKSVLIANVGFFINKKVIVDFITFTTL